MKRIFVTLRVLLVLFLVVLAAAIILGGPARLPPLSSSNDPFRAVDFSDLPPLTRFAARDGTPLAYRVYAPAAAAPGKGTVVLIHGASASSASLHVLAKAFAAAGYRTDVPDLRGHGASGSRGQIDHVGQLEDDLVDFMHRVAPAGPVTLAGFSSGGGLAIRYAGSGHQRLFQSYLFLSPFLSQNAPTARPGDGGRTSVGVPRIMALTVLNSLGVHRLNRLPVLRFAPSNEAGASLTPEYSYDMAMNFRPREDYLANLREIYLPCAVVVGADDEIFRADRFAGVFQQAGKNIPVTVVPGVDHVHLTLSPPALAAAVQAVGSLRAREWH